jgi:hypothetical protein
MYRLTRSKRSPSAAPGKCDPWNPANQTTVFSLNARPYLHASSFGAAGDGPPCTGAAPAASLRKRPASSPGYVRDAGVVQGSRRGTLL